MIPALIVGAVVIGSWIALWLVLLSLPVIGTDLRLYLVGAWSELRAWWMADTVAEPTCPRCGRGLKLLGRQASVPWWYCEPCGRTWPETQLGRPSREAVAS